MFVGDILIFHPYLPNVSPAFTDGVSIYNSIGGKIYTQIQKNLLKITYNKSIMKENHVKLCKDYMVLFLVGRKCSMALIKCPECGKEVSDKAKIFPNCGVDIMENAPNIEPIKKKKRLKYVGLAIILLCLGGLGYWGIKIVPEKQAERDKEIYNEIVKNIEDCKFKTATDIIEEGLSKDNKNKVVLYKIGRASCRERV